VGRKERRVQLKKAMAAVSRQGMDLTASGSEQSWAVIGVARMLIDVLSGRAPGRAARAAKAAHEFFETSLKNNPSKFSIACAKGCAFCCHVSVTASVPEIFLVASRIREFPKDQYEDLLNRVRAADQRTRYMSSQQRANNKIPCAMLKDNLCSVYESRPAACRGFTSTSVEMCRRGFNGEAVQIDTPAVWTSLRNAHKQAMWGALAASKLPAEYYEFHHALRIALEIPDAESRWLAGEDIFADVAREIVSDPTAQASNRRIIDQVVAGALGHEMPA
jgi:Fe-S-cluster containining protein